MAVTGRSKTPTDLAFTGITCSLTGSLRGRGILGVPSAMLPLGDGHLGNSGLMIFASVMAGTIASTLMGMSLFRSTFRGGDMMVAIVMASFFSGFVLASVRTGAAASLLPSASRFAGDSLVSLGMRSRFCGLGELSLSDSVLSPSLSFMSFLGLPFFFIFPSGSLSSEETPPMLGLILTSFLALISPKSKGSGSLNSYISSSRLSSLGDNNLVESWVTDLPGDSVSFFGRLSVVHGLMGEAPTFFSGGTKVVVGITGDINRGGASFRLRSSSFFSGLSKPFISEMMAFRSISLPQGLCSSASSLTSVGSNFIRDSRGGLSVVAVAGVAMAVVVVVVLVVVAVTTVEVAVVVVLLVEGSEVRVEDTEEDASNVVLRRSEQERVRDFSEPVSPSDS